MKFTKQYAAKVLSFRQKLILFGTVTLCVLVSVGTYLVVEYFSRAMEVSIADRQPHLRVFLSHTQSVVAEKIKEHLSGNSEVVRCDVGYFALNRFYIMTHHLPKSFQDLTGDVYFEGNREIEITAYRFGECGYFPPVLLENVYSKANRFRAQECPEDAPIAIMSDPEEKGRNYGIVNKSLTRIFPNGPSLFANRFNLVVPVREGEVEKVSLLTAGYVTDSPLSIGGEIFKIFTTPETLRKVVPESEWNMVVDCSIKNRFEVESLKQELLQNYTTEKVETWMDVNPTAKDFLLGIKSSSYIGVCAILLISIAGVSVLISMLIEEKSKQLAILYALGMSTIQLRSIFIWTGLKVATFACVFGVSSAWGIVRFFLPELTNIVRQFCQIQEETLVFCWYDLTTFIVMVFVLCLVASWLPTRRITKAAPVKYLRSE